MTQEIYTSKDGSMTIVRAAMWCDQCGHKANCVHFAAASDRGRMTLCIPCYGNLLHFIIAGRKYDGQV